MLHNDIKHDRRFNGFKINWIYTIGAGILGILFIMSPLLFAKFAPAEPSRHVEIAEIPLSSSFFTLPDGTLIRFQTVESENGKTFVPVEMGYPGKTQIYKIYPDKESAADIGKYQVMVFKKYAEDIDMSYTVLYVSEYK